jgi:hypothetical protein
MKNKIAIIHDLVEAYDLKNKTRTRGLLYKRYFLYHELRTSGFSLTQIGDIFGKHHASIIHGLKTHVNLMSYEDPDYRYEIMQLREQLQGSVVIYPEQIKGRQMDLKTDILEARTMRQFRMIRRRLKLGVYEKALEQSNFIEE